MPKHVEVRIVGLTNTGKTTIAEVIRRALEDIGVSVDSDYGWDEPAAMIHQKYDNATESLKDTVVTITEVHLRSQLEKKCLTTK